jgi:hypothetical protein
MAVKLLYSSAQMAGTLPQIVNLFFTGRLPRLALLILFGFLLPLVGLSQLLARHSFRPRLRQLPDDAQRLHSSVLGLLRSQTRPGRGSWH